MGRRNRRGTVTGNMVVGVCFFFLTSYLKTLKKTFKKNLCELLSFALKI
jgi:hypothetical protein